MFYKKLSSPAPLSTLTNLPDYAFGFVLRNLGDLRCTFMLLTMCRIGGALLGFFTTYLLGEMLTKIDSIVITEIYTWYLPVLIGTYVSKEGLDYFTRRYAEPLPSIFADHLQLRFFNTLAGIHSPQLYNYSKERLTAIIGKYIDHSRKFLSDWVWQITSLSTALVITMTILFKQSPMVLAINLTYIVAYLTLAFRLSKQFSTLAAAHSEADLNAGSFLRNSLLSLNFITRTRVERFVLSRLLEQFGVSWRSLENVQAFHAYRWVYQLNIFNTLYAGTLCYGLYQVKTGILPLGFLVLIKWSFDTLWGILVYVIEYYVQLVQQKQDAIILRRELKGCIPSDYLTVHERSYAPIKKALEWKDVTITFEREEGPFNLSIPSLTIPRGQKVGIIGQSGSGKSTLFATLYEAIPHTGVVLSDGLPLGTNMPRIASLTPQDVLLKLSLRDNLLLGKEVQPERLHTVVKGCCLDEFCPNLDVLVGTSSFNLSSGQEQRVKLARTLLQDADCIILDEPFNGIDRATCTEIKKFLNEFLKDKTVLIASHVADDLTWVDVTYQIQDGTLRKL